MFSSFSVRKPYTVLVAVIIALILGGASVSKMESALLPDFELPYLAVITTYGGASPEAVESEVTDPIEAALSSASGLKEIYSSSAENFSMVYLEFIEGTDMNTAMLSVRETLDIYADALPDAAGTPMLMAIDMNSLPVVISTVDLDGADAAQLTRFVDKTVIPALESVDGVASVSVSGGVSQQLRIDVSDEKLKEFNDKLSMLQGFSLLLSDDAASSFTQEQLIALMSGDMSVLQEMMAPADDSEEPLISASMISQIIAAMNLGYPNGYVQENGVNYLVRTGDAYASAQDIADQLLVSVPEADIELRIGDVADVSIENVGDESYTKINGNDALIISIQKQSESATATVCNALSERIEELESEYSGLHMVTLMSQGNYVDMVVGSVSSNLIWGAVLAVFVLLIFLRDWKVTGVIALSIPLSLMVALILMYFSGLTLNLLSLSGLALGVGMLVDNSIVVIENIFRLRALGQDAKQAAIDGAKQVAAAIIASTLTTCAVFVPFAFASGIVKQLFVDLALTICFSLLGSLIVALTFVPMMCSVTLKNSGQKPQPRFERFKSWYARKLDWCLDHRILPLGLALLLFAGAAVYVCTMGTEFFPEMNSSEMNSSISFDADKNFPQRVEELEEIIDIISSVEGVETVGVSMAGSSSGSMNLSSLMSADGSSVTAYILLDPERELSSAQIAQRIDSLCTAAGHDVSTASSNMDMSSLTGSGVSIKVFGNELDAVQATAGQLAEKLAAIEGLEDISDGNGIPSQELRITVDKDAAISKGLTVYQVYSAVSSLLKGESAVTSIQSDGDSLNVMVSDSSLSTPSLSDVYALSVYSSTLGQDVPIADVANIEMCDGYSSVAHEGQQRYVTVSAAIADGYNVGKLGDKVSDLLDSFSCPNGISLVLDGENEAIEDAMDDLYLALVLAVILVYLVMVAQFQSLKYPFIIMFTIPLSYTGGVILLALMGLNLSIVAVVGFVMLTGIVVNNGIVFVDCVNQLRDEGMPKRQALLSAGSQRIRPIIMTALTTVVAMLFMAMGSGESAELAQPMAVVIIGGLSYATVLTTVIVPVIYDLFTGGASSHKGDTPSDPALASTFALGGESAQDGLPAMVPASANYGIAVFDE